MVNNYPQQDKPGKNQVFLQNTAFVPKIISIKAGTTITRINKDPAMHTVTSGLPSKKTNVFASKNLRLEDKFKFTFKKKGI